MIDRGGFLGTLATLAAGTLAAAAPAATATPVRPPRLRRGDRVGLIAPASPLDPPDFALADENIRALGCIPVLGTYARAGGGYLAGSDEQRAEDFNRMARDPSIRAIVALRGGYGTMRILPMLDYAALARDPKIVMGFSDLTAVLNAVTARSGIVTFHGPVAAHHVAFRGDELAWVERALMAGEPIGTLRAPHPETLTGGVARGRLAGGNLTLIASLCGTPYAVPTRDAILFFEETQEQPYRIDRCLTQLALAGSLAAATGFIVGECSECTAIGPSPTAETVIAQALRATGKPALAGGTFGHQGPQWVLPIGMEAELDTRAGTLTIPEAAVA